MNTTHLKSFFIISICVLLTTSIAQAFDEKNDQITSSTLPVSGFTAIYGYSSAPILKCPAVSEGQASLLSSLRDLKAAIKAETNCDSVNKEVGSLESIVNTERKKVVELIKKARTEELTDEDLEVIREYSSNVSQKVFGTIQMLSKDNYCFKEDKKKFDLESLSRLTLDASSLLQSVGVQFWGVPVSVGGQVLSEVFKGLDTLVKSRKGYDFTSAEQRENYVNSLCTYYDYRREIENIVSPGENIERLQQLKIKLNGHLNGILSNCVECQNLVNQHMTAQFSSDTFKNLQINQTTAALNKLYVRPLGTYTVRSLTTQKWIDDEIAKRQSEMTSTNYNVGHELLSHKMSEFDDFLFTKQAPKFIDWYAQNSSILFSEFKGFVRGEASRFVMVAAYMTENEFQGVNRFKREAELTEIINKEDAVLDFLKEASTKLKQLRNNTEAIKLAHTLDSKYKQGMYLYNRAIISYNVMATYCIFLKNSLIYMPKIDSSCHASKRVFDNLSKLNFKSLSAQQKPIKYDETVEYSYDFVDSLTKVITQINSDPNRYQFRSQ